MAEYLTKNGLKFVDVLQECVRNRCRNKGIDPNEHVEEVDSAELAKKLKSRGKKVIPTASEVARDTVEIEEASANEEAFENEEILENEEEEERYDAAFEERYDTDFEERNTDAAEDDLDDMVTLQTFAPT